MEWLKKKTKKRVFLTERFGSMKVFSFYQSVKSSGTSWSCSRSLNQVNQRQNLKPVTGAATKPVGFAASCLLQLVSIITTFLFEEVQKADPGPPADSRAGCLRPFLNVSKGLLGPLSDGCLSPNLSTRKSA